MIDDVRLIGVQRRVILVIVLGRIERVELVDLRNDRLLECLQRVELLDVGLGDPLLLGIAEENRRTILRAEVRPLTIELRRIG